jgi:hypothetical protein
MTPCGLRLTVHAAGVLRDDVGGAGPIRAQPFESGRPEGNPPAHKYPMKTAFGGSQAGERGFVPPAY